MKKTLAPILLAGAIGFGAVGCDDNRPEYKFKGLIDGKYVGFYEYGSQNILKVEREDGSIEVYKDDNNDLKLDRFWIVRNGGYKIYNISDSLEVEIVGGAQVDFDKYLSRIFEVKKERALKDISNK